MTPTPPDPLAHARSVLAGQTPPVASRPASTVAIVRDAADGLEVYLLRRVRGMSFAAGMHVFPGGSLEPGDSSGDHDPYVVAAVRETFEEAGVLLAGPTPTTILDDVSGPSWESHRLALETGQQTLPALLREQGLTVRTDLLVPLAHWITPEVEPRRFDTHFFLAALPAGQTPQDVGTEADRRLWVRPADALEQRLRLMPPTMAVLSDLARFTTVAEAMAAERTIETIQPKAEIDGDQLRLIL